VSAALLKKAGANVTGVFIKGWYPPGMPCTWAAERRDAMRVAARLQIPFITFDASEEYKRGVIDYLVSEYRAGRTPNPDVMCNREVKFGAFYRYAMLSGADAIATGHYRSGEKDQSYFLWAVPKHVLEATIFPVGHMEKEEVRKLAKKFNIPVATKKDSQGICFLGSISVEEFLRAEFGTDNPALLYTLGQRVSSKGLPSGVFAGEGPWYVVGKDVEQGQITVSKSPVASLKIIRFTDANWFGSPSEVTEAQYRYRGARISGIVDGDCFIPNAALLETPASGQSVVFYHNEEMVGGGIISE
jgi:tRNA-specific 2-thiouridylase